MTVKVETIRGRENDDGIKGKRRKESCCRGIVCFTCFEKGRVAPRAFTKDDIVCEALKQPLLNANESEQHVGPLAVNCVRTGCKMANAHKIVVATSLYTGYTRRVVVSSRFNSNTIHDSSSRKQLRAITTLNTVI